MHLDTPTQSRLAATLSIVDQALKLGAAHRDAGSPRMSGRDLLDLFDRPTCVSPRDLALSYGFGWRLMDTALQVGTAEYREACEAAGQTRLF